VSSDWPKTVFDQTIKTHCHHFRTCKHCNCQIILDRTCLLVSLNKKLHWENLLRLLLYFFIFLVHCYFIKQFKDNFLCDTLIKTIGMFGEHSRSWKPLCYKSWFPMLLSCSLNIPCVLVRVSNMENCFWIVNLTMKFITLTM